MNFERDRLETIFVISPAKYIFVIRILTNVSILE